jgi:V/A-type H+-transporting ATPase subunit K
MISKSKYMKLAFGSTFAMAVAIPAIAMAQEAVAKQVLDSGDAATVGMAKAAAAAVAMSVSAFSAGYAQSKIGAAAAGTLAERPEAGPMLIVLQALPEIIVLLGFVIAFMINAA